MRRLIIPVLLLFAAACLREPDPFQYTEPALSLHGVLRTDEAGVRLSLFRSPPGSDLEEVDAQVTLSGGTTTIPLTRVPATEPAGCYTSEFSGEAIPFPGCYAGTLPAPPAPGSRWTLTAKLAEGPTITGGTVVPAPPMIVSPAAGARLFFTRLEGPAQVDVQWQTASAPRVEIVLGEGTPFRNGVRLQGATCFVAHERVEAAVGQPSGSRRVTVHDVYCYNGSTPGPQIDWDSAAVQVQVTAFDSAYAEFALHGRSVTKGHRGASLQGAYGVFGSAASSSREVMLIPRR